MNQLNKGYYMSKTKMSIRELKLVLDKLPDESLLDYFAGVNETSLQPVLRIEIPFQIQKK